MKKTNLSVVEKQDDSYILTGDEYETLCEAYYTARSLVRILSKAETDGVSMTDYGNVVGVVLEKLDTIYPLLGK